MTLLTREAIMTGHACRLTSRLLVCSISLSLMLMLVGCDNTLIIRIINQETEGNNEVWVCDGGSAELCRGERKDDIDPEGFQKRIQVVAPPERCTQGRTRVMDIVIQAGKVLRVRYECGASDTGSGLPPSPRPSPSDTGRTN